MEFEEFIFEDKGQQNISKEQHDSSIQEDMVQEQESNQESYYVIKKPRRRARDQFSKLKKVKEFLISKEFGILREASLWSSDNFEDSNFLLFGEIFCYIKSFQSYLNVGSPKHCYLSDFRPVIAVNDFLNGSKILYAQLDSHEEEKDFFKERETEYNNRAIDRINLKLRSLSDQNAYSFTQYLEGYRQEINKYVGKVAEIHEIHNNDLSLLQIKLDQNYQKSEIMILEILSNLEKQSPDILFQFFVKRIDARTLTGKTCKTGGNKAFLELTCGPLDPAMIAYQFSRFGPPEVLDWRGLMEITMAQFTGNSHFQFDLQTLDGFSIPSSANQQLHTLSQVELSDGFVVSDILVIYTFEINQRIIECLAEKRRLTAESVKLKEDLVYTMKSEIFINKFYSSSSISSLNQNKSSTSLEKTFESSQQKMLEEGSNNQKEICQNLTDNQSNSMQESPYIINNDLSINQNQVQSKFIQEFPSIINSHSIISQNQDQQRNFELPIDLFYQQQIQSNTQRWNQRQF